MVITWKGVVMAVGTEMVANEGVVATAAEIVADGRVEAAVRGAVLDTGRTLKLKSLSSKLKSSKKSEPCILTLSLLKLPRLSKLEVNAAGVVEWCRTEVVSICTVRSSIIGTSD